MAVSFLFAVILKVASAILADGISVARFPFAVSGQHFLSNVPLTERIFCAIQL